MDFQSSALFAFVALLVGLSKGGLGGPVPISLTAPLLSLIMPVSQAIGIVLPLLIFADLFGLYFYWRKWDAKYIRQMLPPAIIGVIMGTWLLASLSPVALKRVIGVFTLIAVLYKFAIDQIKRLHYRPQTWHGILAGWAAGFGSALANVGAPPITAYLLLQTDVTPISFIGTSTLFFAIVNALKLPGFLASNVLDVQMLVSVLWVAPLIPFGVWLGRWIVQRMDPKFFERLMLALLTIMSLYLILS
jgi:uncharacterized protein